MRRRRLFWQVYLHGLLLLALVAVTLGVVGYLFGRPPARVAYADWLQAYLEMHEPAGDGEPRRAELAAELARHRDHLGAAISVYEPGGRLVASSVDPPLPPLPAHEIGHLSREPGPVPGRHLVMAVPVYRGGRLAAYAVIRPEGALPHVARGAFFVAVVLVLLAAGSVPLARGIAAPLEQLTGAARRFGAGDLSARSGLTGAGEIGSAGAAFDEMAARLEQTIRGQKELLANVSHELRTPLSRIRVALELAAEGDGERAKLHLAGIAADLAELDRLIEDVLTAARLDLADGRAGSPATPVRPETLDPAALLDEVAERFRAGHPDRTLVLAVAGPLPPLEADRVLVRRTLLNLLDNARKFSAGPAPVTLEARAADGRLTLEVRDQGTGIPPEDLPHLGRPFFRGGQGRAAAVRGLGLGLTLARRVVEAHGGALVLESTPGQGTTVRVTLPVR